MSKRKKKIAFIRQNQNLSLSELSSRTGLDEEEIAGILSKFKEDNGPADQSLNEVPSKFYWIWALLPVLMVILFYLPVLNNDFLNWDDREEIYQNPIIWHLNFQSLQWMLTNHQTYWMPLTWFSWAVNYQIGGLEPKVYHLSNVFLHSLNTLLVYFICLKIIRLGRNKEKYKETEKREPLELAIAFITALLFGLHPIHVESVAWAAERKDVLYAFFYLAAIMVYLNLASSESRKRVKLLVCFGLFLLALMSKPMAVTLPLVFLVLDYWPLNRLRPLRAQIIIEKVPFFIILFSVGLISTVDRTHYQNGDEWFWILNGFRSIAFYLYKMIFPLRLTPFYPFPHIITTSYLLENYLALFGIVALSIGLFFFRRKAPYLWTAWLYYLVVLAPVSGFIRTGSFAAADRYTYLSSLGLFLPASAWIVTRVFYKRIFFGIFVTLLVGALGFGTVKQIGVWENSQTFWECVVNAYPDDNPNALTNLGLIYLNEGRTDDAISMFNHAVTIPPPMAFTHDGMGTALVQKGRLEEAVQQYKIAIEMEPNFSLAHRDLANVYERLGMHEAALLEAQAADNLDKQSGK